jgi:hypothetical protein
MFTLRKILFVDAATCAAMGGLLTLAAEPVWQLTQIPPMLLFYAGLSLFPIGAFMAIVAMGSPVGPGATRLIIAGNVLWIAASLGLLLSGWIAPNGLGAAFILAQAIAVGVLTTLEHWALREEALQPRLG